MKRRYNSLNATFTRYYLSFFLMIPALVMLSGGLAHTFSVLVNGGLGELKLVAAVIARPDYTKIDVTDVKRAGGWVEIVKDNKIVDVLGTKLDDRTEYTDAELGLDSRFNRRLAGSFTDSGYYYSTAMFVGNDLNEYVCVVKIPRGSMEASLSGVFDTSNLEMRIVRIMLTSMLGTVVVFCLLFNFCIMIYSRITAKKITRPLEAIRSGIRAIAAGDLTVRMHFTADREFADIRDDLNHMAGQLQSAEQKKRELEENRKRLIVGISHDLKTPVTTLYGYAKALDDGIVEDPERRKRYLRYIRDKALVLSRLIDDLFRYSQMDGDGYALKRRTEDFAEFLRELIAENYLEIENGGFNLELDIPEEPVDYPFDRAEMHRALSNILGNSMKYNPAGTTITVSLAKREGSLLLRIADDGIGMSEEVKNTVFNEFVRGDAARPSDGGSGLGLAIARRIIALHGGSIEVKSEKGKGTEFTILLPEGLG